MRYEAKKRSLIQEDGFTLPEVLVAMVMMLTVMFALYSIFDMSLRVFSFGNDKTEAVENARVGMERMERELRAAYPYDKINDTDEIFPNYTSSNNPSDSITFGNDLNDNRQITGDESSEQISYEIYTTNDGTLALGRSEGSGDNQPLAEFAETNGLRFTYCKTASDCSPSSSIAEEEINLVRIELEIEVDRGANGPVTQTLTTDVALRNRTE